MLERFFLDLKHFDARFRMFRRVVWGIVWGVDAVLKSVLCMAT